MESYRNVLKKLVKFSKREYQEKKPSMVKVLRIKDIRFLTLGDALKTLRMQQSQNPHYIVLVEYIENLRIYLFSKEGILIEGINQKGNPKFLNELKKRTIIEFKLP